MLSKLVYVVAVLAVVAGAQWAFSVKFNQDEIVRILVTVLGIGGIDAAVSKFKGK